MSDRVHGVERFRDSLPMVQPVLDKGHFQLEDLMGGDAAVIRGARICYQSEATSPEADVRLIRRLMASEPKHNTVFEHAVFRFGVKCPLFVARQWLRHRIACIAGDAQLYFDLPNAVAKGKRHRYSVSVAEFYRRWHKGIWITIDKKKDGFLDQVDPEVTYTVPQLSKLVHRREETLREYVRKGWLRACRIETNDPRKPSIFVHGRDWHDYANRQARAQMSIRDRLAQMQLRMCDETTGEIEYTTITDIWETGIKDVYQVTLNNGYQLKMTADHLCLTEKGWLSLEQATGLDHHRDSNLVIWNADSPAFAVNGEPLYRDKEWLAARRAEGLGVPEIAARAGCSDSAVRAWLQKHGLQYTRSEASRLAGRKQKGRRRTGGKRKLMSEQHRQTLRELHSGPNSNFWKGGVSSERANIARWCTQHAGEVHARNDYACVICKEKAGHLHAHHIDPVWHEPAKATDIENLTTLCARCHRHIHRNDLELAFLDAYTKGQDLSSLAVLPRKRLLGKPRPSSTRLVRSYAKIASIEYVGREKTFDIQVSGPYQNYVTNGLIVHNSYNEKSLRYCIADREYYVPVDVSAGREEYIAHMEASYDLYDSLLQAGWQPERARGVLGTAVYTEFIWTVNAWSFMNWLTKRLDKHAQWEHRQYAEAALGIFRQVMPVTAEAFIDSVLIPVLGYQARDWDDIAPQQG
jgi:thymidylate synthase (FAD)